MEANICSWLFFRKSIQRFKQHDELQLLSFIQPGKWGEVNQTGYESWLMSHDSSSRTRVIASSCCFYCAGSTAQMEFYLPLSIRCQRQKRKHVMNKVVNYVWHCSTIHLHGNFKQSFPIESFVEHWININFRFSKIMPIDSWQKWAVNSFNDRIECRLSGWSDAVIEMIGNWHRNWLVPVCKCRDVKCQMSKCWQPECQNVDSRNVEKCKFWN